MYVHGSLLKCFVTKWNVTIQSISWQRELPITTYKLSLYISLRVNVNTNRLDFSLSCSSLLYTVLLLLGARCLTLCLKGNQYHKRMQVTLLYTLDLIIPVGGFVTVFSHLSQTLITSLSLLWLYVSEGVLSHERAMNCNSVCVCVFVHVCACVCVGKGLTGEGAFIVT